MKGQAATPVQKQAAEVADQMSMAAGQGLPKELMIFTVVHYGKCGFEIRSNCNPVEVKDLLTHLLHHVEQGLEREPMTKRH